jgi:hypothetical protein
MISTGICPENRSELVWKIFKNSWFLVFLLKFHKNPKCEIETYFLEHIFDTENDLNIGFQLLELFLIQLSIFTPSWLKHLGLKIRSSKLRLLPIYLFLLVCTIDVYFTLVFL